MTPITNRHISQWLDSVTEVLGARGRAKAVEGVPDFFGGGERKGLESINAIYTTSFAILAATKH